MIEATKVEKLSGEIVQTQGSVHLDAIRASAAATVFLMHLRLFFLDTGSSSSTPPVVTSSAEVRVGFAYPRRGHGDHAHQAVMVFFVLSGFLVGGSVVRTIRHGLWSWRKYAIHRVVRLWMVLIPALLLGALLDTAGSRHFAGEGTIYSAPAGQELLHSDFPSRLTPVTFLGNVFFLQDILVKTFGINQPLWSLANEFWYYAAFPCVALALIGGVPIFWRLVAVLVAAGILWFTGEQIAWYFVIWLLGVVVAVLPAVIPLRLLRVSAAASLFLFALVSLTAKYDGANEFPVDLLIAFSFLPLLYCVAQMSAPSRPSLYRTVARFVSKISYSMYLTHVPVFCLLSAVLVGGWRVFPLNGHSLILVVEAAGTALLAACAVHFLFEARTDRVRRYLEANLAREPQQIMSGPAQARKIP